MSPATCTEALAVIPTIEAALTGREFVAMMAAAGLLGGCAPAEDLQLRFHVESSLARSPRPGSPPPP